MNSNIWTLQYSACDEAYKYFDAHVRPLLKNPDGSIKVTEDFHNTDIDAFRGHMIDQICALASGPCVYAGRSMSESHRGLAIDAAMFNVVVADLMQAMESTQTPVAARNQLLGMLAPMYRDVVTRY